jgi:hypothetical protein
MMTLLGSQPPGLTAWVTGGIAAAIGCLAGYWLARSRAARTAAGLRAEFQAKLDVLSARLAPAPVLPDQGPAPAVAAPPAAPVSDDVLVLIAAAVTAFLGKKVRVRSARMLQTPYEIVNPWAQQGRVFVQASHNIRGR